MTRWTKASAILGGRALAARIRRTPTARQMDAAPRDLCPSRGTVVLLFGSVRDFQLACGFQPNRPGDTRKSLCKNGHARTPENVYEWPSRRKNGRGEWITYTLHRCKVCHRANSLRSHRRKKA